MHNNFRVLTLNLGIVTFGVLLGFFISLLIFLIARELVGRVKGQEEATTVVEKTEESEEAERKRLSWGFRDFFKGSDGHYSLSNFQFVMWTFMLTFVFLTVWILRVWSGEYGPTEIPELPVNLVALTGIGAASPVISTAITKMKIGSEESLPKKPPDPAKERREHECHFGEMLMQNDRPALNRLQNFAWTCISLLIYTMVFFSAITKPITPETPLVVPEIDIIFVALMGVSTVAFFGGKVVEASQIEIMDIDPISGKAKTKVTIYGINFGKEEGTVKFGDKIVNKELDKELDWKTNKITFTVPEANKEKYNVQVRVATGQLSKNSKEFKVTE